jgi:hypothetical protein
MTHHRCRNGLIIDTADGICRVTLPTGETVTAVPQRTQAQAATAQCLGYGDDVEAMTEDHDATHCLLADFLSLPTSHALRAAAGLDHDEGLAAIEEQAVMAVQRLMRRAGGRMPFGAER